MFEFSQDAKVNFASEGHCELYGAGGTLDVRLRGWMRVIGISRQPDARATAARRGSPPLSRLGRPCPALKPDGPPRSTASTSNNLGG